MTKTDNRKWELMYYDCSDEYDIISDVKKVIHDGRLIDWVDVNPFKRLIGGKKVNVQKKEK